MSWFSKHLGIRLDKHTLGNLVKNIAPVAGTVIGGPLGLAAAGALGAAGEAGRGKTGFGDLARAGLSNAAIAGVGQGVAGHFGYHGGLGGIGGPAAPTPTGTPLSAPGAPAGEPWLGGAPPDAGIPTDAPWMGGGSGISAPTAPTPPSLIGRVGDVGKGVLTFAEEHPNAVSGALQGVGAIASTGSENRLRNAQANALEQQANETSYDFLKRKLRDQQLAPVWSALGKNAERTGYQHVAKNPYAGPYTGGGY